jgi:hypothetical protein
LAACGHQKGWTPIHPANWFAKTTAMGYHPGMRTRLLFASFAIAFTFAAAHRSQADQVELQNGDRFSGSVVSMSADSVVLQSDSLGKITVPRQKIAIIAFGTNVVAPKSVIPTTQVSVLTNFPAFAALMKTNANLSAALRLPGGSTNVAQQIREQLLAGNPEAAGKYDAMVNALMSGQMNVDDLRREAQSSADQLRELKRDLGPDADSVDGYLEVLDDFLKETDNAPPNTKPATTPQAP